MNNWRSNPAFKNMDCRKQRMVELLFNTMNGKKLTEALPILSNWKMQVESEHIKFTPEENALLAELFLQELSPEQRKQYEFLKPFLKNV